MSAEDRSRILDGTLRPESLVVRYGGGPCVGTHHEFYRTLHYLDPEETARRQTEATAVMLKMMRFGHPNY